MKGQLDEAKNQRLATIAQLRARLRRDAIVMHPINPAGKYIDTPGQQVVAWDVNPVWTNTGPTEARTVTGWFENTFVPVAQVIAVGAGMARKVRGQSSPLTKGSPAAM